MNPLTARIGNKPYLWNKGTLVYIGPTCSKFTSVINHILLFILLLICASERCYMGGRMWAVPHIHSYLNDSLYKHVTNSHQLCSHGTNAGVSTLILMPNRFSKKTTPKTHTILGALVASNETCALECNNPGVSPLTYVIWRINPRACKFSSYIRGLEWGSVDEFYLD
jgi:hypothetical protein